MKARRSLDYSIHYTKWHDHSNPAEIVNLKKYFTEVLHPILPADKQASILDIGCGSGTALLALRDMGYTSLTGVDCSPELVKIARSFSLNVEEADAFEYMKNCGASRFSLIYMIDTLEHITTDKTFDLLSMVFDALNPEGQLFLQVPNASSPAGLYLRYVDWTHTCSFTIHSISHLLEGAGFGEITIRDSFPPREPKREDFESGEEGQKNYNNQIFKFRSESLAREFARWQFKRFLSNNPEVPLTPNMSVVAVKKSGGGGAVCRVEVAPDNSEFDLQKIVELLDENTWRIGSCLESNKFLHTKTESLLESNSLINTKVGEHDWRIHSILEWNKFLETTIENNKKQFTEWNKWLETELTALNNRNTFSKFFIDFGRGCFNRVRRVAAIPKRIRQLPAAYERMIEELYYRPTTTSEASNDKKTDRQEWIRPLLQCPHCQSRRLSFRPEAVSCKRCSRSYRIINGRPVFHDDFSIFEVDAGRCSFKLPLDIVELVRKNGGLALSMGAGAQPGNTEFLVDFDYMLCPNTDVVGDGHALPFRDGVFQTVISLNVFEHLRDPESAAREMGRVCKKGGQIIIHTAFVQPQHDFAHYYNATRAGVRRWFSPYFQESSCVVSDNFSVEKTVAWIAHDFLRMVRKYCSEKTIERFEKMTLEELEQIWKDLDSSAAKDLFELIRTIPEGAQGDLSLGFEFIGIKK